MGRTLPCGLKQVRVGAGDGSRRREGASTLPALCLLPAQAQRAVRGRMGKQVFAHFSCIQLLARSRCNKIFHPDTGNGWIL